MKKFFDECNMPSKHLQVFNKVYNMLNKNKIKGVFSVTFLS